MARTAVRRYLTRVTRALDGVDLRQGQNIAALAAGLTNLAHAFDRISLDLTPLAAGVTPVSVVWPTGFPDGNYTVAVLVVHPAANLGQVFWTAGAKTATGCTVAVRNTSGASIAAGLDVMAMRL